jgi:hypothetical protein
MITEIRDPSRKHRNAPEEANASAITHRFYPGFDDLGRWDFL